MFTASLLNRLGIRVSHDNKYTLFHLLPHTLTASRFDPLTGEGHEEAGPLTDGSSLWLIYGVHVYCDMNSHCSGLLSFSLFIRLRVLGLRFLR